MNVVVDDPWPSVTTTPATRVRRLPDGSDIVIRALTADDRDQLRDRYDGLSDRSRRLRFVSAPAHLSAGWLDRLVGVDQDRRVAIVAADPGLPGAPGVGVARFDRDHDDASVADAAVTVIDEYQGRGIGTILLVELVAEALARGVRTFVADVLWDNSELLDALRSVGAVVRPGEPGLASVRVELPDDADEVPGSPLHAVLRTVGRS